jgi:hypothetical protein
MRRCPAGAGARPLPGTQRPAGPVTAESTKYVPGQPFTRPLGNPAKPTTVMAMQPAQAMQMSSKLERIFFGIAWTNAAGGQNIDVDASVISFSNGQQVDCVSFQQLGNTSQTLKHTGDIMTGASTKGEAVGSTKGIALPKVLFRRQAWGASKPRHKEPFPLGCCRA